MAQNLRVETSQWRVKTNCQRADTEWEWVDSEWGWVKMSDRWRGLSWHLLKMKIFEWVANEVEWAVSGWRATTEWKRVSASHFETCVNHRIRRHCFSRVLASCREWPASSQRTASERSWVHGEQPASRNELPVSQRRTKMSEQWTEMSWWRVSGERKRVSGESTASENELLRRMRQPSYFRCHDFRELVANENELVANENEWPPSEWRIEMS